MNCEKCQDLISDLLDGSLSDTDKLTLNSHLEECLSCADVRSDLQSIIGFCQTQRGEYAAPPNGQAMWLRIRNVIESEPNSIAAQSPSGSQGFLSKWIGRSWELSLAQLTAAAAVIILLVSLSTIVGLRRYQTGNPGSVQGAGSAALGLAAVGVKDRFAQQQQLIQFWNQRVEYNKARWSPQMRETFDRNLQVIDQTVNESFNSLSQNPHDEVSVEILNAALNEKLSLLKEFAEL
jgi:anti-sigma factor RsiW